MKNVDEIISGLSPELQKRISERTKELIGQEMALRHLREARQLTQLSIGKILGIGQDGVSRLEKRSDMLISTLESYVKAMGGSLKLVAEFPDGSAVINSNMGLSALSEAPKRNRKRSPRKGLQLARAAE